METKNPYLTTLPDAPEGLPDGASRAWQEVGRAAIQAGYLKASDLTALELAARSLAAVRELENAVERQGHLIDTGTTLKANPALAALDRARGHCRGLLRELRLTPDARS